MIINGIELELDLMDADVADQIEVSLNKLNKQAEVGESLGDVIRFQCGVINEFFDELFGSGASDAIFQGKMNLRKSLEAFGIVVEEIQKTKESMNNLKSEYIPQLITEEQKFTPITTPATKKKFKIK